ncbi:hypothetical protein ACUSIJ_08405 [Pseudochelatococcus sp. B33]
MGAFDDIISALWQVFDQGAPPPGRTAALTVDDIDILLADRGKYLLVRATAGPLASGEPQRGAQIRAALQLALGSLKRQPVLVHVKQTQDQPIVFVEQNIPYGKYDTSNIERSISHIIKVCHIIKTDHEETYSQVDSENLHGKRHEKPMENEVIFRV